MNDHTPTFYMANLGVEVARIFSYKEKNDIDMMKSTYNRAKRILVKLLSSNSRGAREESKIASDIIDDLVNPARRYDISAKSLSDYFMPFMLKANAEAGIV